MAKRKNKTEQFIRIPFYYLEHENFRNLSNSATSLYIAIRHKYKGYNNGWLTITRTYMRNKWNWKSCQLLKNAKEELLNAGLIMETRLGSQRKATLYALTGEKIDDPKAQLDVRVNGTPRAFQRRTTYQNYFKPSVKEILGLPSNISVLPIDHNEPSREQLSKLSALHREQS